MLCDAVRERWPQSVLMPVIIHRHKTYADGYDDADVSESEGDRRSEKRGRGEKRKKEKRNKPEHIPIILIFFLLHHFRKRIAVPCIVLPKKRWRA